MSVDWIVITIGKHVITKETPSGADVGVSIDKPSYLRVVVTALEVVDLWLWVINVRAIAEGIQFSKVLIFRVCFHTQNITPGIIGVRSRITSAILIL